MASQMCSSYQMQFRLWSDCQLLQFCPTVYPGRCWHSAGLFCVTTVVCYLLLLLCCMCSSSSSIGLPKGRWASKNELGVINYCFNYARMTCLITVHIPFLIHGQQKQTPHFHSSPSRYQPFPLRSHHSSLLHYFSVWPFTALLIRLHHHPTAGVSTKKYAHTSMQRALELVSKDTMVFK